MTKITKIDTKNTESFHLIYETAFKVNEIIDHLSNKEESICECACDLCGPYKDATHCGNTKCGISQPPKTKEKMTLMEEFASISDHSYNKGWNDGRKSLTPSLNKLSDQVTFEYKRGWDEGKNFALDRLKDLEDFNKSLLDEKEI